MSPEIHNLKSEIIQDPDEEKWFQLPISTWFLIAGLTLLNLVCFVDLSSIFRVLDVRLCPWWYILFLAIFVAFTVKWFFIYRNREDYDELGAEVAKRFTRMAVSITVVMAILVLLNVTNLSNFFYYPLTRWLGYGDFTWIAFLSFVLIFCAIIPVIYFVKEWLITFVSP